MFNRAFQKHSSAMDAVQSVPNKARIFVHGAAATPSRLLQAICEQASRFQDIEFLHLHTMTEVPYADQLQFRVSNLFVGSNMRKKLDYDRVDYLPCFLSEMPSLFRSGRRPIDVALIHVSTPDQHGYCTLGTSVDVARAAVETAGLVIAQINSRMPHVHGDGFVHISQIDHYIEVDEELPECAANDLDADEKKIGFHCAGLIENGSTLQMGIGAVPDAVLEALSHHQHLGIHSEMWSDGALNLIRRGIVDNSQKSVHPGKTVSAFVMGSRALYDFIDDNPSVIQLESSYVNNPEVIARNRNVVAINSAVEIDLTGQVCADSIGNHIISGVGGQMDFMRAAALSPGGKPIIAMKSRTKKGESRIVPNLKPGAGVVTTRAHVHFVVTEYGWVDLYGKTLGERARALIHIAHPDDRENLQRVWHQQMKG